LAFVVCAKQTTRPKKSPTIWAGLNTHTHTSTGRHQPTAVSLTNVAQERVERSFQWKQEAASEYEVKEQATRLLTAKLREERLAREAKQ
jgi:hypothetical protein